MRSDILLALTVTAAFPILVGGYIRNSTYHVSLMLLHGVVISRQCRIHLRILPTKTQAHQSPPYLIFRLKASSFPVAGE